MSLVFLKLALDGETTRAIGLITSAFSLKSAPKRILKDSSVPLVEEKSLECLINVEWFKFSCKSFCIPYNN